MTRRITNKILNDTDLKYLNNKYKENIIFNSENMYTHAYNIFVPQEVGSPPHEVSR